MVTSPRIATNTEHMHSGSGPNGAFQSEENGPRAQELCVKVEVAVLGSPSLTVLTVSVDVRQRWTCTWGRWAVGTTVVSDRCKEDQEKRVGSEFRSCVVKVEVAVLGSPPRPSNSPHGLGGDVKQHWTRTPQPDSSSWGNWIPNRLLPTGLVHFT